MKRTDVPEKLYEGKLIIETCAGVQTYMLPDVTDVKDMSKWIPGAAKLAENQVSEYIERILTKP